MLTDYTDLDSENIIYFDWLTFQRITFFCPTTAGLTRLLNCIFDILSQREHNIICGKNSYFDVLCVYFSGRTPFILLYDNINKYNNNTLSVQDTFDGNDNNV